MFCLLFFVMHVVLFLSAMRFRLGTPPPRGTVGCATFPFRVDFRLCLAPPRHDCSLREGFDFGFPCLRVCVLLQFAFLRLAPPATPTIRVAVRRRVRVEMRSEDGFTVGGAGEPGEAGADVVGPVVSTESVPCVGLLEGVGWATTVAAVGVSTEPAPTSVGTAKTEAKLLSAAGKARPRPEQRSTVATDAETRATNKSPRGSSKVVDPHTLPVCAKIAIIGGGEREPSQDSTFGAGH